MTEPQHLILKAVVDALQPFEWMSSAACVTVDSDLFFPEFGEYDTSSRVVTGSARSRNLNGTRAAKLVCEGCEARVACLDYGWNESAGIYGGTTASERKTLRRTTSYRPPSTR